MRARKEQRVHASRRGSHFLLTKHASAPIVVYYQGYPWKIWCPDNPSCRISEVRISEGPLYIHTYVHTYAYSVRMPECVYVQHVCVYIRTYVSLYMCMYVCTYVYTYVHTSSRAYVHTYVRTYTHTYIHPAVLMYIRTCICMYVCSHSQVRTYGLFEWFRISCSVQHRMSIVVCTHAII